MTYQLSRKTHFDSHKYIGFVLQSKFSWCLGKQQLLHSHHRWRWCIGILRCLELRFLRLLWNCRNLHMLFRWSLRKSPFDINRTYWLLFDLLDRLDLRYNSSSVRQPAGCSYKMWHIIQNQIKSHKKVLLDNRFVLLKTLKGLKEWLR